MTDIDQLRAALREQPEHGYATPDLGRIFAEGARLRRRRQVLQGSAFAAAVAVVALVVGLTSQLRPAAPPVADGVPTITTASPSTTPVQSPLGNLVPTGIRDSLGERVFYVVPVDSPSLPDVHFGLMAGHRTASGTLVDQLMTNVTTGSDTSPGFRVLDGGDLALQPLVPVFGYYVGPAAKITTTVQGRTVVAQQVTWAKNPDVVLFWFTLQDVPSRSVLTPPRAYAADGTVLRR
jgi:hypothetical protein